MAETALTANAADARVRVVNATFATARAATTGTLQSASTNPTGMGDDFSGGIQPDMIENNDMNSINMNNGNNKRFVNSNKLILR